jgi:RHS repeat-associated protein
LSQLTKIDRTTASNPGHLITDYQYDAIGLRSKIDNYFNTPTTGISNYNYSYDPGNRLILTTGTDGNSAVDYGNDNQLKTIDNATRADEAYDFNALGIRSGWSTVTGDSRRVLNDGKYEYRYDDEGNLTQKKELLTGNLTTYEWDYRNRLMKVVSGSQTVEYGYDAEDKRVSKKLNGVTTEKYVYDGADIALVLNAAGTLVERYLYGAGVDNVLSREKSGVVVWSLGDRQGSVVDLVSENGVVLNHFVYDGFGTRTGTTAVDFRYGYTGRELDTETGLYYYRARYYDSKVGRFISEDPMGFGAGDTNLYRYVGNNSTNYTDPTGTLISGWAEDLLLGADQLAAGFANVVSFGLTNKIRSTNKLAVENQEGWLYNLGTGLGLAASLALNPAGAGATWARGAAAAYQFVSNTYGALEAAGNILSGNGTAWDLLNFAPAVGFAAQNGRKISGALRKAGDAGDTRRSIERALGIDLQPQLILSAERRSASATARLDDVDSHQFAMMTGGSGSGGSGGSGASRYQGTSTYEFLNRDGTTALNLDGSPVRHSINHLTSPIEIPENATVIAQAKTGQGRGEYYQVQFKWNGGTIIHNGEERSVEWLSRWHTKTPGAPRDESTWVVERYIKGIEGKFMKHENPPRRILQRDKENHFYLQPNGGENPDINNPDNWVNEETWDAARSIRDRTRRSPEQEEMLDRGHWDDRTNRR